MNNEEKKKSLALLDDLTKGVNEAMDRGYIGQHTFTSGIGEQLLKIIEDDKRKIESEETKKHIKEIYHYLAHGEFPNNVTKKLTSSIEDLK
jgi:hypothetical protein